MMLAAVVVPLVHALVDHLLPGIPLHGGSLFVALLLTYALLTLTARLSLEVSGSMVTLTRKVLGVPWFIAKRPRAEVQVVMNPGFSSATLEARCAAWQQGAPLTLVDEQFHGLSALELEAWAAALADGPPIAIRITKRMMYKQQTMDLENALEDAALSVMITNYCEDVKEGTAAFHEKRKPDFKGR